MKILAIVNNCHPAWYCENCKDASNILYMDKHYCERCVPDKIKKNATYVNQNREELAQKT